MFPWDVLPMGLGAVHNFGEFTGVRFLPVTV
jgi:hypothetical protein